MKLFVWQGDGVLQDWTSGIMVVLANDIQQAREVLVSAFGYEPMGLDLEPQVFEVDKPIAFYEWGGG